MFGIQDTIVAPITAVPGPVAIVRVSGPSAWDIARALFTKWPEVPDTHHAVYGAFTYGDDGLALPFTPGHGYTGEESVEFSIHGSRASVNGLIESCLQHGARLAQPGEFTRRAFLNGRMDLTQAEAVRDTIEAETDLQLRLASLNREGALQQVVKCFTNRALDLLALVEASVDFSEEIGDLDHDMFASQANELAIAIDDLARQEPRSRIARIGMRVAILGRPNAGKSSLLNALLGQERAIVTAKAGTTRDFVEESVVLGGVRVILVDTAGLRTTEELAESIGIERALAQAAAADEVWYLYDAQAGWNEEDDAQTAGLSRPVRVLANKSDLMSGDRGLAISAQTGQGLDKLIHEISKLADHAPTHYVNERHSAALFAAAEAIQTASQAAMHDDPYDLLSVLLRDALNHLGYITGETASPEIIDEIFSRFCVGK